MTTSRPLLALRLLCLVALFASGALLVDYGTRQPTFCGPGSGCEQVRSSGFGYLVGIPLPVVGVVGFGGLLLVATIRRYRPALLPLALAAGLVGLALLALQATAIGVFCSLCVAVDLSALAIAALALLLRRGEASSVPDLHPTAWLLLGAVTASIPAGWHQLRPPPGDVPPGVRALYRPGKINVAEYADFECPFCRALHPRLKAVLAEYGDRVHLIRLNLPLDRHPNARGAARAAICAGEQGKGEAMADALFAAEPLTASDNRAHALALGLDAARFDACVANPETDRRIDREAAMLRDHGLLGLPTVFVGERMIVGAQPDEVFRDALDRAARNAGRGGVPAWLYATLAGVLLAAIVFGGWRWPRRRSAVPGPASGAILSHGTELPSDRR